MFDIESIMSAMRMYYSANPAMALAERPHSP